MQRVLLIVAVIVGLLITYLDSRPNWDDAGITAFSLLLSAAILGLFVERRAWLYGLAIGVWIPVIQIFETHDFKLVLVLIFPIAGVYAGWVSAKPCAESIVLHNPASHPDAP